MIHLNKIPLDFEPRRKMIAKFSTIGRGLENLILMSEFESAFLCGLLKIFRPKKIVEVGTAAGGSTTVILQALEDIGERYEMHSIDVAETQIHFRNEPSGFLTTLAKERKLFTPPQSTMNGEHKFHLGKILPQVIDGIGGGIDFVILDTMHSLPGEVLDFLAVLPYLTDEAVVVLHDVSLHQCRGHNPNNATGVLFSAVTAEKFLNFQSNEELFRYPNIAAFQINEQTAENIENVFLSLILHWNYFPTEQVVIYRQHYRRFYAETLLEIFQDAVDMNAYNIWLAQHK